MGEIATPMPLAAHDARPHWSRKGTAPLTLKTPLQWDVTKDSDSLNLDAKDAAEQHTRDMISNHKYITNNIPAKMLYQYTHLLCSTPSKPTFPNQFPALDLTPPPTRQGEAIFHETYPIFGSAPPSLRNRISLTLTLLFRSSPAFLTSSAFLTDTMSIWPIHEKKSTNNIATSSNRI